MKWGSNHVNPMHEDTLILPPLKNGPLYVLLCFFHTQQIHVSLNPVSTRTVDSIHPCAIWRTLLSIYIRNCTFSFCLPFALHCSFMYYNITKQTNCQKNNGNIGKKIINDFSNSLTNILPPSIISLTASVQMRE